MTDLEIQIAVDAVADALRYRRQKSPDEVEEYLIGEARRVAQEQRDHLAEIDATALS